MSPSHQFRSAACILGLICASSIASAQAEPGLLRGVAVNRAFSAYTSQHHIWAERLAGDAAGVFTCCLTTQTSPSVAPDVVIGAYDQAKGTFTPSKQAGALNTSRWDYGLSLEPRLGRYAVLGRGDGSPSEYLFAARTRPGIAFPAPVKLSGVPVPTFSLNLGYVGGKLRLFYVPPPYDAVLMHTLDVSNLAAPKLIGTPVVVARPTTATNMIGLATPVTGRDGDVEGLLISEGTKPWTSSIKLQTGLDPRRPGGVAVAACGIGCAYQYATFAGGRLLFAKVIPNNPSIVHDVEVAWLLGDVVAPGGTADITGAVSSAPKAVTLVFGSGGMIPKVKLPSPLHVGHFALDLRSLLVLGIFVHPDASQLGGSSFPIPNDARLRGLNVALQGLSFDATAKPLAWTNTAWLNVR